MSADLIAALAKIEAHARAASALADAAGVMFADVTKPGSPVPPESRRDRISLASEVAMAHAAAAEALARSISVTVEIAPAL